MDQQSFGSEKSLSEQFMSGDIDFDTYQDNAKPPTDDSGPSWSPSDDSPSLSSSDRENTAPKTAYVNQMPVGAEDGNHGIVSRVMSYLGIYHTNASVESPEKVTTSGMGRDESGNSDMPIGMPTIAKDQTQRNINEQENGNLTKVPVSEYQNGRYKNADPDKLEQEMERDNAASKPLGTYGAIRETEDGRIRPNICWYDTEDRLERALPQEERDQHRQENREYYEGLAKAIAKGDPENGFLD